MRIDPDSIYLEPTHAHIVNRTTGATRSNPAVYLHFKYGGRWHKRLFDAPTFAETLGELGAWIDQHGIGGAIEQAADKAPT